MIDASSTLQAWMSAGGVVVFGLVWLGLALNIAKIARRDVNPPRFSRFLNATQMGRFAGWALVGAATLSSDALTGMLLLTTRIPAVGLVAVTFLQRRDCRPPPRELAKVLVPLFIGVAMACGGVAWLQPRLPELRDLPFGLPAATALHYGLNAFVVFCFAVQVLYGLPKQILQALVQPLGNLRWFQAALLANYAYALAYAAVVRDPLVGLVMQSAYGFLLVEQAVFVCLIERGVRRMRRINAGGGPTPEGCARIASR